MKSATANPPQTTCDAASKGYHVCECYGHTQDLPEYKKLAVPRTLQGFHAKEGGGCPCIPKTKEKGMNTLYCSSNPATCERIKPTETYRAYSPGKHKVHLADEVCEETTAIRDPATGTRLVFPNSRNYGGTATQRKFRAIGDPKEKTQKEKRYERMQDRKEFLKAVLRDEIRDLLAAEEERESLELQTGLRGSRHVQMLTYATTKDSQKRGGEDDDEIKTVSEQYDEVLEELRYVTKQPVGSKVNIIRLHYLLEEQERLQHLREQEKKKQTLSSLKTTKI
ncbi:uncharacterized protein TM35_000261810 [Trypanosoma theileri]|uniref:Uncharacterized protein n=1 Tax=Trypanosoma theileri TaxID=67003 RepID=A0A1X0NRC6_9TRYP|nr:uncharacterized protein TM35_000261810 [Trypanosoma theileri]ORC86729.1 hypothetical protein TM35_000261810 [Trypanosoma theileri]